jgi:hypothetical protein
MAYNYIEVNFIVNNEFATPKFDAKSFGLEPFELIDSSATMIEVLVQAGIFPSKNQARSNWKRGVEIPHGCSEWLDIGKAKSCIYIFKPMRLFSEQDIAEWEEEIVAEKNEWRKNTMETSLRTYKAERLEIQNNGSVSTLG